MKYVPYVHPLQGTASTFHYSNGNTLPLISRPFGMASWSPQTKAGENRWYFHPADRHFFGLRLTHQPSPWIEDYGHVTLLPQSGPRQLDAAMQSSSFHPEEMVIAPDYYSVQLLRYRAQMELTPSLRSAMLRLSFAEREGARLVMHTFAGASQWQIDGERRRLIGCTSANHGGVPENFAHYIVMEFDCELDLAESGIFDPSLNVISLAAAEGEQLGACIGLKLPENGQVHVRIGTSFISCEQAARNMARELGELSFDELRAEAAAAWEQKLGILELDQNEDQEKLATFYTCLYRVFLFPRTWYELDANEEKIHYSAFNGEVCKGPMYSDIGFWDVYRTTFPLYSLLCPEELGEMLESWVHVYKESGWMPKWVSPGERGVMPGTLVDAVFADAAVKGIQGFDLRSAYEGLLKHATQVSDVPGAGRQGLAHYLEHGYLPHEHVHHSVSYTLDYVYGDFCIAQIARALDDQERADAFVARSRQYRNLLDPSVGFMRGRTENGEWLEGFDPLLWGGPYCEGGAWQCSWAVQHDFAGLAELLGGKEAMIRKLDELMTTPPHFKVGSYGQEIHEMSEMAATDLGQFAISNQPSFHIPYIYTALGSPAGTQCWVRKTLEEQFSAHPDGLPGDEDNGSLSAWYIFGAIGLFPLCPGVPEYVLGSPLFRRVTLHLANGKSFVIEAEQQSRDNKYVADSWVNGEATDALYVTHEQILAGGVLKFQMTDTPTSKTYAHADLPYSLSRMND
ncbi:GH92 family glycosyl hydrolase [Paenibacillus sp. HWE-109]|uniref:GH92 family glycosyl hydrolase n=1 Tax=Paenibacillus sp. HWE-109 TaxID=1306526 RepID=UPI001EE00D4E|nr:GH92 family glycosyl hydrolase [Paenibacillus sp. HWE-109]UKS25446.1 GH92 family glycosyl hydrolase [Paenibacillus sp. HWE-109]